MRQDRRLRVLLFARTDGLTEPEGDDEPLLPALAPLAVVALSERMRPDAATTVAYLHRTGVNVKVISATGRRRWPPSHAPRASTPTGA